MSDALSALNAIEWQGQGITICDSGMRGMISLRGDLASPEMKMACKAATGLAMPGRGEIVQKSDKALAWMSPDELLLMLPYSQVKATRGTLAKHLKKSHFLEVDISDARCVFAIEGPGWREVLAKLSPADIRAMSAGKFIRSRVSQVAAAFWMYESGAELICFRSVAGYVFDILCNAAEAGPVGHLPQK